MCGDGRIAAGIWASSGIAVSYLPNYLYLPEHLKLLTHSGDAGGLSDHVVVPEKHAIPLPGSIPLDIGGKSGNI